ncbi:hypothetical protein CSOJ01_13795 [Colletotrichum sojae]|uniref:SnoaL-like domain-containing protein n=1 Tax=Colletotrichum sojae TaxID=2175907 RepID=A0A8H6IRE6_9PEZI|nr:hypothetical protein CSOJ01_13795 [Colletotrichum sojae]
MRSTAAVLSLLAATLAAAAPPPKGGPTPDPYEAIHQASYLLASLLDTKQYSRLGEAMTDDIVYDSRPLGAYGGLSNGLAETTKNIAAAFGDALNEHQVGNALIKFNNREATSANVSTYLTWTRWDPENLHDITKTFRIFERCDDLFVVDPKDGRWKLKYSLVVNQGPQVEAPYFPRDGKKHDGDKHDGHEHDGDNHDGDKNDGDNDDGDYHDGEQQDGGCDGEQQNGDKTDGDKHDGGKDDGGCDE